MIVSLEEFRCPDFRILPFDEQGERFVIFHAGDTIGEILEPSDAMSLALARLEESRKSRESSVERRMLPAVVGRYQPAAPAGPRHIDDQI